MQSGLIWLVVATVSAITTTTTASVDPVEIVAQLAPLLNWPAVQIPVQHADGVAAVLVRPSEVRDEALTLLSRMNRYRGAPDPYWSPMASACHDLIDKIPVTPVALLRRTLALSSLLALFASMSNPPAALDELHHACQVTRRACQSALRLGSDSFLDQLAHVFVGDVGRFLHRSLWSQEGITRDAGEIVTFVEARYLATSRSDSLIRQYHSMPTSTISLLNDALIALFRLIPFTDKIDLLSVQNADAVHELALQSGLALPEILPVPLADVAAAFYCLLDQGTIFQEIDWTIQPTITNSRNPTLNNRLAHCIAVRIAIVLLRKLDQVPAFASLNVSKLAGRLQDRQFQEAWHLFTGEIRLDTLHVMLNAVVVYVDTCLTSMTQLNQALFLAADATDLAGIICQLTVVGGEAGRAGNPNPVKARFVQQLENVIGKLAGGGTAPSSCAAVFCCHLLTTLFLAAEAVNPLIQNGDRFLDYQQRILSRLPTVAKVEQDRVAALFLDYLGQRAIDLVLGGDDTIQTLVMRRVAPLNDPIERRLMRHLNADDSVLFSAVVFGRLKDLRSPSEVRITTRPIPITASSKHEFKPSAPVSQLQGPIPPAQGQYLERPNFASPPVASQFVPYGVTSPVPVADPGPGYGHIPGFGNAPGPNSSRGPMLNLGARPFHPRSAVMPPLPSSPTMPMYRSAGPPGPPPLPPMQIGTPGFVPPSPSPPRAAPSSPVHYQTFRPIQQAPSVRSQFSPAAPPFYPGGSRS